MEEFDELVQAPDDSGLLDLSHRAWVTLDDAIWTWGTSLIVLNVSFNRVESLPPGLGQLALLRNSTSPITRLRSSRLQLEAVCVSANCSAMEIDCIHFLQKFKNVSCLKNCMPRRTKCRFSHPRWES